MVRNKLVSILQSKWSMPALFTFAVFFWAIDFVDITVCVFALYVCLVFFFCEDIKSAFAPMLYIHFFVEYIFLSIANWLVYGVCIGLAVIAIIYYVIRKIIESKKLNKPLKKGKLFWPLICADVGFLLGGIIGNFNFISLVVTFGFCVVVYLLYWISINFCKNLKEYFIYLFLCGAIFISIQILFIHFTSGDLIQSIINRQYYIGSQNINVAALFISIGMIASFSLGYKNKNDYLYFILSVFFCIMIFITYCRMMIVLSFLALLFFTIISHKKSQNKKQYNITFLLLFSVFSFITGVFFEQISTLVGSFIVRFQTGDNLGRADLWKWCIDRFKEYPIFGYGFISPERIPTVDVSVIMAHNTPLQFLTSTGIIGTILISYFYITKYKIMFKNYNKSNLFIISIILLIALSGITDQAPVCDIFVYLITILLLCAIEQNPKEHVTICDKSCLCYGANRALCMVKDSTKTASKVVLYKELLHNPRVVSDLKKLGVSQVNSLDEIQEGEIAIIRAHGEPKSTYEYFEKKGITYLDCTCPNVKAINTLVEGKDKDGYKIIIVGKYGKKTGKIHPEVEGTAGHCHDPILVEDETDAKNIDTNFNKYYLVVQTTFSTSLAEEIIKIIANRLKIFGKTYEYKNTTCKAQREINSASVSLAKATDVMFVVGGKDSSNTRELYNNVSKFTTAFFVENLSEVKECLSQNKIKNRAKIGLTGGASTEMSELYEIKEYLETVKF